MRVIRWTLVFGAGLVPTGLVLGPAVLGRPDGYVIGGLIGLLGALAGGLMRVGPTEQRERGLRGALMALKSWGLSLITVPPLALLFFWYWGEGGMTIGMVLGVALALVIVYRTTPDF